ncbi:hypothetical protein N7486_005150 [Penicillium sp. IBT 16267x]|nr:hypothetical protein N7486_005150 [Penicillium sp. IBT 16267x]
MVNGTAVSEGFEKAEKFAGSQLVLVIFLVFVLLFMALLLALRYATELGRLRLARLLIKNSITAAQRKLDTGPLPPQVTSQATLSFHDIDEYIVKTGYGAVIENDLEQQSIGVGEATAAMCKWRCERRQWELDLVVNEWEYGDMKCLSPRFDLVHLLARAALGYGSVVQRFRCGTDSTPDRVRSRRVQENQLSGGEVFLYPKLAKPYYTLKSITDNAVPKTNVIFNEAYATERSRLQLALLLIKTSIATAEQQLEAITAAMCKWRCDRRQWELDLVTNEWKYGDLKRLSPGFDLVNLLDAKAFVMHQNDKDRAGEIDYPDELHPSFRCSSGRCCLLCPCSSP